MDQAGYNVLAIGGNHRRFIVECDQFSAPVINAFSAHLGECVLSLQVLDNPVIKNLDTFLTHKGQFLRLN